MFLGKLKYASPEQAGFLKEGEHLDPRSDLYSFGIVMYEMLAGTRAVPGDQPARLHPQARHREAGADRRRLNPEVEGAAAARVDHHALAREDRATRAYATAAEFAHALEAIRNTIPPDQKYGLGERMITLSGAQTLADLPKVTGQQRCTSPARSDRTGPTGTRSAADEATVDGARSHAADAADDGRRPSASADRHPLGSDEATVMENFGARARRRRAVEQKWAAQAAPRRRCSSGR